MFPSGGKWSGGGLLFLERITHLEEETRAEDALTSRKRGIAPDLAA